MIYFQAPTSLDHPNGHYSSTWSSLINGFGRLLFYKRRLILSRIVHFRNYFKCYRPCSDRFYVERTKSLKTTLYSYIRINLIERSSSDFIVQSSFYINKTLIGRRSFCLVYKVVFRRNFNRVSMWDHFWIDFKVYS